EMKINGVFVAAEILKTWIKSGAFFIPSASLKKGKNELQLAFTLAVSEDGSGLNTFKDGSDLYFYTDFQPFYTHRLFPCFDQPDLKATFQVEVDAPESWSVVTVNRESNVQPKTVGRKIWNFPVSESIPTYAFPLFAGPFAVISGKAETTSVPLRIFVRRSRVNAVPAAKIFHWTDAGISWMANYLNTPFPFSKYDQIFVPGFHSSGMENAGATTLNESFLVDTGTHSEDMRDLMSTLFHEVVHAWFGNSVTYKWWNGLWLHEGLSNLFAMTLMREVGGDSDVAQYFYTYLHSAAEEIDLGPNARPVISGTPDTNIAEGQFDAITYAKSATMLSRLFAHLGAADVRTALQTYVSHFKGGTPTFSQFFDILERVSGNPLDQWQDRWLKPVGINQIKVIWECGYSGSNKDLLVKSLMIEQGTSPKQGPHRSHSLRVGLLNWSSSGKSLEVQDSFFIRMGGARTFVREAEGARCPAAVDPNLGGHAYVRELLDSKSAQALLLSVGKISDPLHRQRVWKMLWDLVRTGALSAVDYIKAVVFFIPQETNFYVLNLMTETAFSPDLSELTAIRMLPLHLRMESWKEFEKALILSLKNSNLPQSSLAVLADSLIGAAVSADTVASLLSAVSSSGPFAGVSLTAPMRWKALGTLARFGKPGLDRIARLTLSKDISDEAALRWGIFQSSLRSRSRRPEIWRTTQLEETTSQEEVFGTWKVFHWIGDDDLNKPYGFSFFRALPKWIGGDPDLLLEKVMRLYPSSCDPEHIALHEAFERSMKVPGRAGKVFSYKLKEAKVCLAQRTRRIPIQEPGAKKKSEFVL
ncbi:MAG: ERAP1-like C-terminal domain-containing protein, partial [Bdellovibrionales bacterium]|nr:ERAP1-like C-terminal domain-containing protein [Bdellovibrionales bacterium]